MVAVGPVDSAVARHLRLGDWVARRKVRIMKRYEAIEFGALPVNECCCGTVQRAFADLEGGPASVHLLELSDEPTRSEEHTSELQSRRNLVCRLLLEKKKTQ